MDCCRSRYTPFAAGLPRLRIRSHRSRIRLDFCCCRAFAGLYTVCRFALPLLPVLIRTPFRCYRSIYACVTFALVTIDRSLIVVPVGCPFAFCLACRAFHAFYRVRSVVPFWCRIRCHVTLPLPFPTVAERSRRAHRSAPVTATCAFPCLPGSFFRFLHCDVHWFWTTAAAFTLFWIGSFAVGSVHHTHLVGLPSTLAPTVLPYGCARYRTVVGCLPHTLPLRLSVLCRCPLPTAVLTFYRHVTRPLPLRRLRCHYYRFTTCRPGSGLLRCGFPVPISRLPALAAACYIAFWFWFAAGWLPVSSRVLPPLPAHLCCLRARIVHGSRILDYLAAPPRLYIRCSSVYRTVWLRVRAFSSRYIHGYLSVCVTFAPAARDACGNAFLRLSPVRCPIRRVCRFPYHSCACTCRCNAILNATCHGSSCPTTTDIAVVPFGLLNTTWIWFTHLPADHYRMPLQRFCGLPHLPGTPSTAGLVGLDSGLVPSVPLTVMPGSGLPFMVTLTTLVAAVGFTPAPTAALRLRIPQLRFSTFWTSLTPYRTIALFLYHSGFSLLPHLHYFPHLPRCHCTPADLLFRVPSRAHRLQRRATCTPPPTRPHAVTAQLRLTRLRMRAAVPRCAAARIAAPRRALPRPPRIGHGLYARSSCVYLFTDCISFALLFPLPFLPAGSLPDRFRSAHYCHSRRLLDFAVYRYAGFSLQHCARTCVTCSLVLR